MHIGGVYERRIERIANSLGDAQFRIGRAAYVHDGHATIFQRVIDILEVGVDVSGNGNNLSNGFGCVADHFIRLVERVGKIKIGEELFEFLVVDYEDSIGMLSEFSYSSQCFADDFLPLKLERYRNDSHGEYFHFLRNFSHYGRSSGAGTATHSGSDEHHLRAV